MDVKAEKILRKIEEYGKEIRIAAVPRPTAEFLHDLVLKRKAKKILELGTSVGYSTIWFASAVKELGGHIYTTDASEVRYAKAWVNFQDSGLADYITAWNKNAIAVMKNWSLGELDLIFIDAMKADYLKYYELALPLVKKGGMIVADDVKKFEDRMKDFLDFVKNDSRVESEFVDIDDGLLLIQKL